MRRDLPRRNFWGRSRWVFLNLPTGKGGKRIYQTVAFGNKRKRSLPRKRKDFVFQKEVRATNFQPPPKAGQIFLLYQKSELNQNYFFRFQIKQDQNCHNFIVGRYISLTSEFSCIIYFYTSNSTSTSLGSRSLGSTSNHP